MFFDRFFPAKKGPRVDSIDSIDQAFLILDQDRGRVPFDAIRYLRSVADEDGGERITRKITFVLRHAYTDSYFTDDDGYWSNTPLWYAVVAEERLSWDFFDDVVALFTTTRDDSDYLNEQGMYLLCQFARLSPDRVMEHMMPVIDRLVERDADLPYLFLFSVFHYVSGEKYQEWFLRHVRKPKWRWKAMFCSDIVHFRYPELVPLIEQALAQSEREGDFDVNEYGDHLSYLRGEHHSWHNAYEEAYGDTREYWEKHYHAMQRRWDAADDEEYSAEGVTPPLALPNESTGRNAPCPCGAMKADGTPKKYKHCCAGAREWV